MAVAIPFATTIPVNVVLYPTVDRYRLPPNVPYAPTTPAFTPEWRQESDPAPPEMEEDIAVAPGITYRIPFPFKLPPTYPA